MASMFQRICSEMAWCRQDVLEATLDLAIEIGREGREGRRVSNWSESSVSAGICRLAFDSNAHDEGHMRWPFDPANIHRTLNSLPREERDRFIAP